MNDIKSACRLMFVTVDLTVVDCRCLPFSRREEKKRERQRKKREKEEERLFPSNPDHHMCIVALLSISSLPSSLHDGGRILSAAAHIITQWRLGEIKGPDDLFDKHFIFDQQYY